MVRKDKYRFSFGPWNIHSGADPFGPAVRKERTFANKIKEYKKLGFDGVQLHDDDVVPADWDAIQTKRGVARVRKMIEGEGLAPEFIAPRLWEDPRTIDGGITNNNVNERQYAIDRSKRSVDIANMIGAQLIVWWPAREGTYLRESKDAVASIGRMVEWLDILLDHDPNIKILGEMKPNEPMDQAYSPTVGHFLGLSYRTKDPKRVGALIESAHSILAGLDPADDMAYALWHGKLWSVHLNDQNGLKYDQDRSFGAVNLRRAFNQVDVLDQNGFGLNGEYVGLDVKALRTQKDADATLHLKNSREVFNLLLQISRSIDRKQLETYRARRNYEALDMLIMKQLMNVK
ncbi:MAG: xylose isomerase [Candidatus Omnitrophota bacterium]|jgi:xylose isomerase|nr:MAG: xylose isomerase [Candidatus Omnitrophota bacterium]